MNQSQKTGKGHCFHLHHHLLLKTLLGSDAHLLDYCENLLSGLLAPITFIFLTAARLNTLNHHSDLAQYLDGAG